MTAALTALVAWQKSAPGRSWLVDCGAAGAVRIQVDDSSHGFRAVACASIPMDALSQVVGDPLNRCVRGLLIKLDDDIQRQIQAAQEKAGNESPLGSRPITRRKRVPRLRN